MRRSAGLARTLEALVPVAPPRDDIGAEGRALVLAYEADARRAVGVDWAPPRDMTEEETAILGMAAHECAHIAVAMACDGVPESVSISRVAMTGVAPYWPRSSSSVSATIALVAVLTAGVRGYEMVTGDVVGAYLSGSVDRDDAIKLLAREGLSDVANAVQRFADLIVEAVLCDRRVWRATSDLAIRLAFAEQIDGAEIENAIVIPANVRERVARLLDLEGLD